MIAFALVLFGAGVILLLLALSKSAQSVRIKIGGTAITIPPIVDWAKILILILSLIFIGLGVWIGVSQFISSFNEPIIAIHPTETPIPQISTSTYTPNPKPTDVIASQTLTFTPISTSTIIVMPSVTQTPPLTPALTQIPPIILKGFIVQNVQGGQEFYLDIRKGKTGISLEGYILEITFQGGDGREAQIFFKDCGFDSVYAFPKPISDGQPMRFNPATDDRAVDEFSDFTCINAVGAKIFGGVQGVKIVNARLIKE
jgi:hypothetical protein